MELQAHQRIVLGKKVKVLRRQGLTPVHVYGRGMASQTLQVVTSELHRVLMGTGRNALVDLTVPNGPRPSDVFSFKVMLRDIQRNTITGQLLHVDFYRVEMTEPMEAEVPITLVGVAPAVERNLGTLVHGANTIRVLGLPDTLPSSVECGVSTLDEPHHAIHARDIPLPPGVTLVSDPDQVVASIVARRGGAEEEAAAAEEAPAAGVEKEEEPS